MLTTASNKIDGPTKVVSASDSEKVSSYCYSFKELKSKDIIKHGPSKINNYITNFLHKSRSNLLC